MNHKTWINARYKRFKNEKDKLQQMIQAKKELNAKSLKLEEDSKFINAAIKEQKRKVEEARNAWRNK